MFSGSRRCGRPDCRLNAGTVCAHSNDESEAEDASLPRERGRVLISPQSFPYNLHSALSPSRPHSLLNKSSVEIAEVTMASQEQQQQLQALSDQYRDFEAGVLSVQKAIISTKS